MEFVDYKCLESLLIEGEEIAQEGILKTAGKVVGGTIGAILATYAATILGLVLMSKAENKSNQNSYARKTGVNKSELSNDIKKHTESAKNDALKLITKLMSDKKYVDTIRSAIAKKLKIELSEVPASFKVSAEQYDKDWLIVMIDDDIVSDLYYKACKRNDLDLDDVEFGDWINATIRPSIKKVIEKLNEAYEPQVSSKMIRFEDTDHWQEHGLYIMNLS